MQQKLEHLRKLINTMDLPPHRKSRLTPANIEWLQKHMARQNSNHPNYTDALKTIKAITMAAKIP